MKHKPNVFSHVQTKKPPRSMFDLSYEKKFCCDMGQLIPVMCDEVVPGDVFVIGNQSLIRCFPMVAPIMHEVNVYVHYFFVPYRLLWDEWEDFITGGPTGELSPALPRWATLNTAVGSIWDFMGLPTGVDMDNDDPSLPLIFPLRAYNFVYNEYYRDETLQTEVDLSNGNILNRNWEKDYFTSSLPFQQRGIAPALPIIGTTSAVWTGDVNLIWPDPDLSGVDTQFRYDDVSFTPENAGTKAALMKGAAHAGSLGPGQLGLNNNTVDLSTATSVNISDLRVAFQIQRWLEANARAGARYTEFLHEHFAVSPRDERLQRPEYIGGSKSHMIISEVLQTSETATTAQGNLAGHGIGANSGFCGKYHAQEFGLILGLMSIMPRSNYQQGINRQWIKNTKYDFYFPEFANLSEQAVIKAEICAKDDKVHNNALFGYQGRYDEMRYKPSQVCSQMRSTFSYWHLGRIFDPDSPPALNSDFVTCVPRKDIFADNTDPGLLVHFGNIIKAFRPLPVQAQPGLVDHN